MRTGESAFDEDLFVSELELVYHHCHTIMGFLLKGGSQGDDADQLGYLSTQRIIGLPATGVQMAAFTMLGPAIEFLEQLYSIGGLSIQTRSQPNVLIKILWSVQLSEDLLRYCFLGHMTKQLSFAISYIRETTGLEWGLFDVMSVPVAPTFEPNRLIRRRPRGHRHRQWLTQLLTCAEDPSTSLLAINDLLQQRSLTAFSVSNFQEGGCQLLWAYISSASENRRLHYKCTATTTLINSVRRRLTNSQLTGKALSGPFGMATQCVLQYRLAMIIPTEADTSLAVLIDIETMAGLVSELNDNPQTFKMILLLAICDMVAMAPAIQTLFDALENRLSPLAALVLCEITQLMASLEGDFNRKLRAVSMLLATGLLNIYKKKLVELNAYRPILTRVRELCRKAPLKCTAARSHTLEKLIQDASSDGHTAIFSTKEGVIKLMKANVRQRTQSWVQSPTKLRILNFAERIAFRGALLLLSSSY